MGIAKTMTGTSWQVVKLPNPEGRRYRSNCLYYTKVGRSDYCSQHCNRCMGSAHCDYYKKKDDKNTAADQTGARQSPASTCIKRTFQNRPITQLEEKLTSKGTRVCHKGTGAHNSNGYGTVTDTATDQITVSFESGKQIIFKLPDCMKHFSIAE